jgi:RHH-type transcriptional regulator, rel operon repressor / antitoxin RelB
MATLSIRLDTRTASTVDRVAAQTGKTKSEIVREALIDYAEKVEQKSTSERPYDKMAPDIGCWDSGGMQLSTRTGEKFAEMLRRERDARRAGRQRTAGRRSG